MTHVGFTIEATNQQKLEKKEKEVQEVSTEQRQNCQGWKTEVGGKQPQTAHFQSALSCIKRCNMISRGLLSTWTHLDTQITDFKPESTRGK